MFILSWRVSSCLNEIILLLTNWITEKDINFVILLIFLIFLACVMNLRLPLPLGMIDLSVALSTLTSCGLWEQSCLEHSCEIWLGETFFFFTPFTCWKALKRYVLFLNYIYFQARHKKVGEKSLLSVTTLVQVWKVTWLQVCWPR